MCDKSVQKCWTLETIPTDILYVILSYCDFNCFHSLSCCSKKFYYFFKTDEYIWLKKSLEALVTNQRSNQIRYRSSRLLTPLEKCRISVNWKNAVFNQYGLIRHKSRYLPWIWLDNEFLWFTKGNAIFKYKRNLKNGSIYKHCVHKLLSASEDICRFVIKDNYVISGGRKGSLAVWDKSSAKRVLYQNRIHSNDVNSVDFYKNKLISGSKDKYIKIWTLFDTNFETNLCLKLENTIEVKDRVWSVAINELDNSVMAGTAGCGQLKPLVMFDIQTGKLLSEFGDSHQRGAGVLHTICESNTQALTCGYDSCVRLWDTRSPHKCVINFDDPHDSVVYCIASDHCMTVMSGTARYGLTRLWDKRKANDCIQMYFVGSNNSPVYSLSFDPLCAYIALESSINLLSFN